MAVDAALGPMGNVGAVNLRRGGLLPGQGVGKTLPRIGELAVTATVNVQAGALDVQVLQSTRLFLVQQLAELIGVACWWAHRNVRRAAAREPAPDGRRLSRVVRGLSRRGPSEGEQADRVEDHEDPVADLGDRLDRVEVAHEGARPGAARWRRGRWS